MALTIDQVAERVRRLRQHNHMRDSRWNDLLAIRQGDIANVFPGMFSEDFPKPMVGNSIDVFARDIAEVLAPLPAFTCMTTDTTNDKARSKADKRSMIAAGYRDSCDLQTKMYSGADYYITFGMLPIIIEPDYENNRPMIRIESPLGAYPEFDRFGRLLSYSKHYLKTVRDLCNQFPELQHTILNKGEEPTSERTIDMFRYQDKDQTYLFLPERNNLVLAHVPNELDEIPVVLAVRPGVDQDNQRGQFDDIMWVQVARGRFANLQLEAAQKSVQSPFALPADVNVLEIGPDATIRSATPEKIRRVPLEVPQGVFQEGAQLDQELMRGARYPEGRLGQQSGSIITGKGVQALMGGFDTQIKTGQSVFAEAFRKVMFICFKMDETLWPNVKKEVRGINAGAPYEITYTPKKDIAGDYYCDVTYGLMAGLDPNRALVFGLQARGDHLISREFLRRNLPWELNVTQEEQNIEVEQLRDTLLASMNSYASALPALAAQGQDPSKILTAMATVIKGRQQGQQLEDLIQEAFAAPPPEQAGSPGGEPTPGQAPMMGQPGQITGPPGAAPQGGPPAMQSLLAGLSGSGAPTLAAGVRRQTKV
jgi:hypothetical protein